MTETLSALDATFLELEQVDQGALMTIGGLMVFDPLPGARVPTLEELRVNVAARLGGLPRYAQRLSEPHAGGLSWPHWVPDERFDIRNHIRHGAVPAPGSDEQACDWLAEYFSHPLDRSRPLWEMVLLDELAEGRWAIGHRTHHCLVDGVGSVDVAELLLDHHAGRGAGTARTASALPAPSVLPAAPSERLPGVPEAVSQAAHAGVNAATGAVHAMLHPRDALARSRALAEMIIRDELIGAPRTSLNVPIGQGRRYTLVRTTLADCKAVGRAHGATVNDVLLAACTYGVRQLLLAREDELPARGLRAMVPINLRDATKHGSLGNRVSSLFIGLPVAEADPLLALEQIAAETKRKKLSGAARGPATMIDLAELAPPAVVSAALAQTTFSRRLFNITITNVPGSREPLYSLGSRLREIQPVVPLAADHAAGIAIFSYAGSVSLGISADSAMTDLKVLADGIAAGLELLRASVPEAAAPSPETAGVPLSPV